ncbi:hypothetical protein [Actinoplanes xinjiangensis]|uniref:hypothetical protein n=1 Tax=Actinoplanes xinjiangensis TaxID=512350 RepID=UPI001943E43C|nr:hypothetical protein [Actinoplanes xinjiangensis]GIF44488.1 hypothetical protein Axi01nite_87990 [Actinoplanes xinjiangensis]
MKERIVFGFGAHTDISEGPELLRAAQQADRDGLDVFSLSDHPYLGGRLDAYATVGSCSVPPGGWPVSPTSPICPPGLPPCWPAP